MSEPVLRIQAMSTASTRIPVATAPNTGSQSSQPAERGTPNTSESDEPPNPPTATSAIPAPKTQEQKRGYRRQEPSRIDAPTREPIQTSGKAAGQDHADHGQGCRGGGPRQPIGVINEQVAHERRKPAVDGDIGPKGNRIGGAGGVRLRERTRQESVADADGAGVDQAGAMAAHGQDDVVAVW